MSRVRCVCGLNEQPPTGAAAIALAVDHTGPGHGLVIETPVMQRPRDKTAAVTICPGCGDSGYATTIDGRTLGVCDVCNGNGGGGKA